MKILPFATLSILGVGALICCNAGGSNEPFDQGGMLASLSSNVIVPSYEALEVAAGELEASAASFCADPSVGSTMVERALESTLVALRRGDPFAFGPHTDQPLRLGPLIDSWPVDPSRVNERLAEGATTAAELEPAGVRIKGLPVVGYLLFGPAEDLGPWETGGLRCRYLLGTTQRVAAVASSFVAAWSPGAGNHSATFTNGDEPYGSVFSAASLLGEQLVFVAENARELRVGKPFGKRSAGRLRLEEFEAAYGELSLAAVRASFEGLENAYNGELPGAADGIGFSDWVVSRNPQADALFRMALADTFAAIDAVESAGSLESLVAASESDESARQLVENLYQVIKSLQEVLAVDVAMSVGITVTFNPTDGD